MGCTYGSLSPSNLTFYNEGKLIYINNDKTIYLEVGSYSDDIYITLDQEST